MSTWVVVVTFFRLAYNINVQVQFFSQFYVYIYLDLDVVGNIFHCCMSACDL